MKIGKVIRTYRKERNMTQEEMANRLGVTAPAVNKWENGNSLPDITLLSPIARLLGITPDILLSFEEELTTEEITLFVRELNEKLKTEVFDAAFQLAKQKVSQYPNCEQLIWQTALVLDAWRKTHEIPDSENYDFYICSCYERALESEEESIRTHAADSLFGFYTAKENYAEAEKYLSYFPSQSPERKRKQAFLYSKTERRADAWKAYEELLFSEYQMASMVFQSLYLLSMEEGEKEKTQYFVEKQMQLAKLFEMGMYHELSCQLDLAVAEQDADTAIKLAKGMLESVSELSHFRTAPLYQHMTFRELEADFTEQLREHLLENFRDEEAYAFLKNDVRWQALIK